MPRLISALLALALVGCAHAPASRLELPEPRIAPADMRAAVDLFQRLRFEHDARPGDHQVVDALLEMDAHELRFAGFVGAQRVLSFVWDGQELTEQRSAQVPEPVRGWHILRDVQYVYAPIDVLRAALPAGWMVEESRQQRLIRPSDDGPVAVSIHYADDGRLHGDVRLNNRVDHYLLRIDHADPMDQEQP